LDYIECNVYFRDVANSKTLKYIVLGIFLSCSSVLIGQDLINWYTWEEGMTKSEEEPKKFLIDLYTDWCGWCVKMDKTTFQDPEIAAYVNKHYIAIKFDAEQKEEIAFKEQLYKFVRSGKRGYHQLAALLTNGKLSYPTVVFMDEQQQVIQALPGFLDAETFDPIIMYFAEDMHKTMSWSSYLSQYKKGLLQGNTEGKAASGHTRLVKGN